MCDWKRKGRKKKENKMIFSLFNWKKMKEKKKKNVYCVALCSFIVTCTEIRSLNTLEIWPKV